ncbi:MAG TPA: GGDEF domain-containing protein [Spirochaetota bacterium]|nr:GGDEF domain-containing protein [Spirochaetota bacterium]HPI87774.1 GGDEF domain-containing protein [Spirochaetota bacterium]HPR47050.1 GGDEF domain-containing protein [Spirochaetota bacterium]
MADKKIKPSLLYSKLYFKIKNLEYHELRKRIIALFIVIATSPVLIWFSVSHMHQGELLYGLVIFSLLVIFLVAAFMVHRDIQGKHLYRVITFFIIMFFIYMLLFGRSQGGFVIWILLFPAASFFVLGKTEGMIWTAVLLVAIVLIMLFPDPFFHTAPYNISYSSRFILTYLLIAGMTYIYEASRYYYQKKMEQQHALLMIEKDKLSVYARKDFLTGLSNRHYITELIEYERGRKRRSGKPFAIIMSDIDDFKRVNDSNGHDCGDQVLVHISEIMRANVRFQDYISRWGGEEFLLLLPETDVLGGKVAAEKIRTEIKEAAIEYNNNKISVTMSFGVTEIIENDEKVDDMIKRADRALYQAKKKGKNRVEIEI